METQSIKIKIELSPNKCESFERLKNFLAYPDFNKPFDLATGASARGLSAVLSQENRSMTTKNISLPTSSQEPEELFVLESTALSRKKNALQNENVETTY